MKNIILIETSVTHSGTALFESAKSLGVNLVFLYQDLSKYESIGISKYLKQGFHHVQVDTRDLSELKTYLTNYQKNHSIDGIICLNDRCIEHAATLAEWLELPFMNANAVSICRNKDLTAQHCSQIGIRTPQTVTIRADEDLRHLKYPIILKPSRGFGSTDVYLCRSQEEFDSVYPELLERAKQMNGTLLIQEYILGPLVSVEALTCDGKTRILGFTDRILGPLPYFVEMGINFPVDLGQQTMDELTSIIHKLIDSLGIQYGTTHTEFILASDGPVLIEMNPRLGGGFVGTLISRAYEYDLFTDMIRLSQGIAPQVPKTPRQALSFSLLYPEKKGKINQIKGIDLAKASPGVLDVFQKSRVGDDVGLAINHTSRAIAGILASGATTASSSAHCRNALNQIVVEFHNTIPLT